MQGRSGKRGALLTFAVLLTVSSGTAYAADPIEIKETTSIAVKDGASYSYGSDETESLTIAVENSDDGAAIAVDGSSAAGGSKASLTLSGKTSPLPYQRESLTEIRKVGSSRRMTPVRPMQAARFKLARKVRMLSRFPESFAPLEQELLQRFGVPRLQRMRSIHIMRGRQPSVRKRPVSLPLRKQIR